MVLIASQTLFIVNFVWSLFRGPKATDNPWEATTLEWTTTSPPPHDNFGDVPTVHRWPYEYGLDAGGSDFADQRVPPEQAPVTA